MQSLLLLQCDHARAAGGRVKNKHKQRRCPGLTPSWMPSLGLMPTNAQPNADIADQPRTTADRTRTVIFGSLQGDEELAGCRVCFFSISSKHPVESPVSSLSAPLGANVEVSDLFAEVDDEECVLMAVITDAANQRVGYCTFTLPLLRLDAEQLYELPLSGLAPPAPTRLSEHMEFDEEWNEVQPEVRSVLQPQPQPQPSQDSRLRFAATAVWSRPLGIIHKSTFAVRDPEESAAFCARYLDAVRIAVPDPSLEARGIQWVRLPGGWRGCAASELHFVPWNHDAGRRGGVDLDGGGVASGDDVTVDLDQRFIDDADRDMTLWSVYANTHIAWCVADLTPIVSRLQADGQPFFGPMRRADGVFQIFVELPHLHYVEVDSVAYNAAATGLLARGWDSVARRTRRQEGAGTVADGGSSPSLGSLPNVVE